MTRRYADLAAVAAWRELHESCAACWRHWRKIPFLGLQTHHMLGGRFARPDRLWNLLCLCASCHERLGHGRANLAICLTLKRESNAEDYDPAAMQEHMRRFGDGYRFEILPEPAELPAWLLAERLKS